MKIGFYMEWDKRNSKGDVIGEELLAEALCKELRKDDAVTSVDLYAPNFPVDELLDVMIYLTVDMPPVKPWAKKHVFYWQSASYRESLDELFKRFYSWGYDGYIFFSESLLAYHMDRGHKGLFLPFGVDPSVFSPLGNDRRFACEVSYIGNDIKGTERTMRYLYPATKFDFALFGNWKIQRHRFRLWKNRELELKLPPYKKVFEKISRGRIPEGDVPLLYSNAKVNLNCSMQKAAEWGVVSLRIYQILACKGFVISDPIPAAEKRLQGKVVFSGGGCDLEEKIRYYLVHERERLDIAKRGYDYVLGSETIAIRAKNLLNYLEGLFYEND